MVPQSTHALYLARTHTCTHTLMLTSTVFLSLSLTHAGRPKPRTRIPSLSFFSLTRITITKFPHPGALRCYIHLEPLLKLVKR